MNNTITLQPVDFKNWRTVVNLKVATDQLHTIESNKDSMLEAAYDTNLSWVPLAIYSENLPIGFTMIGALDETPGTIWLDRFMIDYHYQGQGYGKASFEIILHYLSTKYPTKDILLSVHGTNTFAINFYKKFGFKITGDIDPKNNEIIMLKK